MTINYKGMDNDYRFRVAEISYDDENKKESVLLDRIVSFMEKVHGYSIDTSVSGLAFIEVVDYQEYKEVAKIYQNAKRVLNNCMKYGF